MGCVQSVGEEEDVSVNEKEALHENEFITVVLNDYIEDSNEKDYEDTGEDRMERVPASGPILVRDDGEEGARGGKRKKKKTSISWIETVRAVTMVVVIAPHIARGMW